MIDATELVTSEQLNRELAMITNELATLGKEIEDTKEIQSNLLREISDLKVEVSDLNNWKREKENEGIPWHSQIR